MVDCPHLPDPQQNVFAIEEHSCDGDAADEEDELHALEDQAQLPVLLCAVGLPAHGFHGGSEALLMQRKRQEIEVEGQSFLQTLGNFGKRGPRCMVHASCVNGGGGPTSTAKPVTLASEADMAAPASGRAPR